MFINVTAMTTDSAVTALSFATTFTVIRIHCHTNMNIAVTALPVGTSYNVKYNVPNMYVLQYP